MSLQVRAAHDIAHPGLGIQLPHSLVCFGMDTPKKEPYRSAAGILSPKKTDREGERKKEGRA
jgi:hypothetical protein